MSAHSLAPTLTLKLFPPLIIGDSGEDPIELLCTPLVKEDVMLVSYKFTWTKDDIPLDLSDDRIVVCINISVYATLNYLYWLIMHKFNT